MEMESLLVADAVRKRVTSNAGTDENTALWIGMNTEKADPLGSLKPISALRNTLAQRRA